MKILVLSNRHYLLPMADQLAKHHTVTTVVMKDRYEVCWNLTIPKQLVGKEKSTDSYKKLFFDNKTDDGIVITDSRKMTIASLEAGCRTYGVLNSPMATVVPNLFLLGWFDGTNARFLNLAVPDWGLWPGGLGPFVLSGVTINRWKSAELGAVMSGFIPVEEMKKDNFLGFFAVHLRFDGNGFARVGYSGAWAPILSHAYLAGFNYEEVGMSYIVDKLHTVALPVSVPPYPLECNYRAPAIPLEGELMNTPGIALHDVTEADNGLSTAQTDGLVSVVVSSADRLTKARMGAMELASKVRIPQVQWRGDVGNIAERLFDLLEDYGL